MALKKAGLLVKEFSDNVPPDVSISMVVKDLTKLFSQTATTIKSSRFGSGNHYYCNSISDEVKVVTDILENINPLRLESFGRGAAGGPTATWDRVLADGVS